MCSTWIKIGTCSCVGDFVIVDGDRGLDLGVLFSINISWAEARDVISKSQRKRNAASAVNQTGIDLYILGTIIATSSKKSDVTIPIKYIRRPATKSEVEMVLKK